MLKCNIPYLEDIHACNVLFCILRPFLSRMFLLIFNNVLPVSVDSDQEAQRYITIEKFEQGGAYSNDENVGGAIYLPEVSSPAGRSVDQSSGYASEEEEHVLSPTMGKDSWRQQPQLQCDSQSSLADSQYLSPDSVVNEDTFFNDIVDDLFRAYLPTNTANNGSCAPVSGTVSNGCSDVPLAGNGLLAQATGCFNTFSNDVEMMDADYSHSVQVTLPASTSDPANFLQPANSDGFLPPAGSSNPSSFIQPAASVSAQSTSAANLWEQSQLPSLDPMDFNDIPNLLCGPNEDPLFGALPPLFPECTQESSSMIINDVNMAPMSQSPVSSFICPPKVQMSTMSPSSIRASQPSNGYQFNGHVSPANNGIRASQSTSHMQSSKSGNDQANAHIRDEHNYFKHSPRGGRHGNGHVRFAFEEKPRRANSSTILEQFLTTKEPLNSRQTSDHITNRLSKMYIAEQQRAGLNGIGWLDGPSQQPPNLLKKLLTEEGTNRSNVRVPRPVSTPQQHRVQQQRQLQPRHTIPTQPNPRLQQQQQASSLMPPPLQPPTISLNTENFFHIDSTDPLADLLGTDISEDAFSSQWTLPEDIGEVSVSDLLSCFN